MAIAPPDGMEENPYQAPREESTTTSAGPKDTAMDRIGRRIIIAALLYMLLYLPCFSFQLYRMSHGIDVPLIVILPGHIVGMALNFAALAMTIRDLYLRRFRNPKSQRIWFYLIIMTGGIGWIVYIFKYALKPRTLSRPQQIK